MYFHMLLDLVYKQTEMVNYLQLIWNFVNPYQNGNILGASSLKLYL